MQPCVSLDIKMVDISFKKMCKTCRNRFKCKSPFIKAIKKDPDGKRHTIGFEPKKKGIQHLTHRQKTKRL